MNDARERERRVLVAALRLRRALGVRSPSGRRHRREKYETLEVLRGEYRVARKVSLGRVVRGRVTEAEVEWVRGELAAGRSLRAVAHYTGRAASTYEGYLYGFRRPVVGDWVPPGRRSELLSQENAGRLPRGPGRGQQQGLGERQE